MCGGTQPRTASLTFLPLEESEEVMKSIQSLMPDLPDLASPANNEMSQQLSQEGTTDNVVMGRAFVICKQAPDLGREAGQVEELRGSSCDKSPEPKSGPGKDPGRSELCGALPKQ